MNKTFLNRTLFLLFFGACLTSAEGVSAFAKDSSAPPSGTVRSSGASQPQRGSMSEFSEDFETAVQSMESMGKKLDTMLKTGWGGSPWGGVSGNYTPRLDLHDGRTNYVLRLDAPGMSKEDLSVEAKEDMITISGERKFESSREEGTYSRQERSFGSFSRTITFGEPVRPEAISAEYKDGVLTVTVPKKAPSKDTSAVKVKIG